jgi:hypothetical protein
MDILSALKKTFDDLVDNYNTPQSFADGEAFENYVRKHLFVDNYYKMIDRTHSYKMNSKDYVEASKKPDFKMYDNWSKKEFYLEAKYRYQDYKGKYVWCNESQLKRYQEYCKELPVFLILGIGGLPKEPEKVSLIPMSEAKYVGLFPSVVEKYLVDPDKPVSSKVLWNR